MRRCILHPVADRKPLVLRDARIGIAVGRVERHAVRSCPGGVDLCAAALQLAGLNREDRVGGVRHRTVLAGDVKPGDRRRQAAPETELHAALDLPRLDRLGVVARREGAEGRLQPARPAGEQDRAFQHLERRADTRHERLDGAVLAHLVAVDDIVFQPRITPAERQLQPGRQRNQVLGIEAVIVAALAGVGKG